MRPQKIKDTAIMDSLVKTFRSNGYDGTSLAELSKETGLKKASLYHRFPNGKQEMAIAVLNQLHEWVDEHVIAVLTNEKSTPSERILKGIEGIRNAYNNGNESCVFSSLSLGQSSDLFHEHIKKGLNTWINAFKHLGLSIGFSEKMAHQKAVNSVIEIQGSLIVTKGLNDLEIFENTLKTIISRYSK